MAYKNQFQKRTPRFSAENYLKELETEFKTLHDALKIEFEAVSKANGGTTIINRSSVAGGGGGGSALLNLLLKNVSGSFIKSGVESVNFDDSDYFVLSHDGALGVRVDLNLPSILGTSLFRCGVDAVSTSGTTIAFSSAFGTAPDVFPASCYNASGDQVAVTLSSVGVSSFLATPLETATLEWVAFPNYYHRSAIQYVFAGDNTITFQRPFSNTNYVVIVKSCFNTSGDEIGATVSNKQTTDFTLNVLENSLLSYEAFPYS